MIENLCVCKEVVVTVRSEYYRGMLTNERHWVIYILEGKAIHQRGTIVSKIQIFEHMFENGTVFAMTGLGFCLSSM